MLLAIISRISRMLYKQTDASYLLYYFCCSNNYNISAIFCVYVKMLTAYLLYNI